MVDVERYVSVCQRLAPRALLDELGTAGTGGGSAERGRCGAARAGPGTALGAVAGPGTHGDRAVLGLDARELDPDTGFFDLGMDSIIAVSLKTRLENDTDTELPVTLTFELPTPRKVARHLAELLDPRQHHLPPNPPAMSEREAFGWPGHPRPGRSRTTPRLAEATDDELLALLSQATASARDLLQEASQW